MLWLILTLVIIVVALLVYVFPVIQVCGCSMCPTFNEGDIILGCRLGHRFKPNEVYVFTPPVGEKYVIKRLTVVSEFTGKLFFEGDNPDKSYDSRMYGYIARDKVVAHYILTIHKRKECSENGCK